MTRTISSSKKESPVLPRTTECPGRQRPDFESVYRFVDNLGATFDVELIARGFLTTIMEQLGAKRASLYLVEPGRTSLEPYWLSPRKESTSASRTRASSRSRGS